MGDDGIRVISAYTTQPNNSLSRLDIGVSAYDMSIVADVAGVAFRTISNYFRPH